MLIRVVLAPLFLASLLQATVVQIDFPPKDREVPVGAPVSFGVIPQGLGVRFQWSIDGVAIPAATNDQLVIERAQPADAGVYSVVVSDEQGFVTNSARLQVRPPRPGDVDFSFQPSVLSESTDVQITARQADGKLILIGGFDQINGELRGSVARLNPDGSTDRTFMENLSGATSDRVNAATLQDDGKLLISGYFNRINGESWGPLARLNRDSTLDRSFTPGARISAYGTAGLFTQPDGKILVGGAALRLNTDGSQDPIFNFSWPPEPNPPSVAAMALQPDGEIILGFFGERLTNAARLKPDGRIDKVYKLPISFISSVEVLPTGKILIAGEPRMVLLNQDGTVEGPFAPQLRLKYPFAATKTLSNGKIAVSGVVTSSSNITTMVLLDRDGTLDPEFQLIGVNSPRIVLKGENDNLLVSNGNGIGPPYAWVTPAGALPRTIPFKAAGGRQSPRPIGFQSDGRFLLQNFGSIQRLNLDGTVDPTFEPKLPPNTFPGPYAASTVQLNDKVLVELTVFPTSFADTNASVVRLNRDGDLDQTFTGPRVTLQDWRSGFITSFRIQKDGKVLVGGLFSTVSGLPRNNLARLNSDGTCDTSFVPDGGLGGILFGDPEYPPRPYVASMHLQDDGKIIVTGLFTLANGVPRTNFARFNSDGSLDLSFTPPPDLTNITALAIEADGKLLVAARTLLRLNPDGAIDPSFRPTAASLIDQVQSIFVLPNQSILIGGAFQTIDSINRPFLAQLDPQGALDENFLPGLSGPDARVSSILFGADGKLIVVGDFMRFNGEARPSLVRMYRDGVAIRIKSLRISESNLALEWTAAPGQTYQLEYKTNLNQSTWLQLPSSVSTTTETASSTINLPGTAFIRVKLLP